MKLKKAIRFIVLKSVGKYINFLSYIYPQKALALAYGFFSQPKKGRIDPAKSFPKTLQRTYLKTFKYNNQQFQSYVWLGNETKILLVHGWESNAARWKKTLPYLQKSGCTIIALDAPAHGQSSGKEFNVPLYAKYINVLVERHQPTIIIGHSIGGFACMYHQYLYPKSSIQKMVVLGAPFEMRLLFDNFSSLLGLNKKVVQLLEQRMIDYFGRKIDDFSVQEMISEFKIKAFIAHDQYDKIVPFSQGKKTAMAWPEAHFVPTKGLGHALHNEELYEEMTSFLFERETPPPENTILV